MQAIQSVIPIFLVILLGTLGKRKGLLPDAFLTPANRLAFYLAIPALIFRAMAKAPLAEALAANSALAALLSILTVWVISLIVSGLTPSVKENEGGIRGTWVQGSFHGNLGFLGIAVIFYSTGEEGVALAGLPMAVMLLLQNALAVITLSRFGGKSLSAMASFKAVAMNPVIIAAAAGLLVSLSGYGLPLMLGRTLDIVAGMGLPLALLIIGANLSRGWPKGSWGPLAGMLGVKLALLPLVGLGFLELLGVGGMARTVTVIFLASPTATTAVILATQMGGHPRFAATVISVSTALSAVGYTLWLLAMGG